MRTPNTPTLLGQAIRAANEERTKQDDQSSGKPASSKTRKPENQSLPDEQVNLSIKVGKKSRVHWLIEAKRQGTTLTDAITDALNARFGAEEEN